ncbi:MAG: sodium:proton antiporter [Alphaproteobacteria bacterium]|nr:sodium:proton antiporter [Alphaproteobacteria bacterium]
MNEYYLITLSLLLVLGVGCQLLAWQMRVPAILFLLLTGFIVGPFTGAFDPDTVFGNLLFPMVSLGVAVILFEGSLTLRFTDISKSATTVVWRLVSIGLLITLAVASISAHHLMGIDMKIALLFGAIVTVTGPTVIMPMLRSIRPKADVANVLRWEAIVIDPLGAILAVILYEYVISQGAQGLVWLTMGKVFLSGALLGTIFAGVLAFIVRHHIVPDFLMKIFILAYVIGVYTACDLIQSESGLLAVTIMGIVMANMKGIYLEEILDFKESLSIIIISGLFIILAARMDLAAFSTAGWTSILVLLVIMIVARPLGIFFSTLGSGLSWKERALMSWIAPRGIIAAAIAPLFALKLEAYNIEGAEMLAPLVFIIIIGTVVLQSLTAGPLAVFLGVAEPEPNGVLIVGANRLARTIAHALKDNGFNVLLAGTNWEDISEARMEGLSTFFGNVVSEYADRHMDLMGIGKMLAISKLPTENALASMRYRREFGNKNVFIIKTEEERRAREKDHIANQYTAPFLFGGDMTQAQLTALLAQGHEIRSTGLTENFTYENFLKQYEDEALPLFIITKRKTLEPFIEDMLIKPEAGSTILSLLPPQEKGKAEK